MEVKSMETSLQSSTGKKGRQGWTYNRHDIFNTDGLEVTERPRDREFMLKEGRGNTTLEIKDNSV